MKLETAIYKLIATGPGGRYCPCCSGNYAHKLKRMEHRKARRTARKQILEELEADYGKAR